MDVIHHFPQRHHGGKPVRPLGLPKAVFADRIAEMSRRAVSAEATVSTMLECGLTEEEAADRIDEMRRAIFDGELPGDALIRRDLDPASPIR